MIKYHDMIPDKMSNIFAQGFSFGIRLIIKALYIAK